MVSKTKIPPNQYIDNYHDCENKKEQFMSNDDSSLRGLGFRENTQSPLKRYATTLKKHAINLIKNRFCFFLLFRNEFWNFLEKSFCLLGGGVWIVREGSSCTWVGGLGVLFWSYSCGCVILLWICRRYMLRWTRTKTWLKIRGSAWKVLDDLKTENKILGQNTPTNEINYVQNVKSKGN